LGQSVTQKYQHLQEVISEAGSAAVAFSGGVDSSFLLKTSVDVLGPRVLALHASSILQHEAELVEARSFMHAMGCDSQIHTLDPLSWPEFSANSQDRCYHCKKAIYTLFLKDVSSQGLKYLFDGTNVDDLQQDRPGLKAIEQLHVRMPLVEADLNKQEIRQLSRQLGLETWQKYSASCLATRIPSGATISGEKIEKIRQGEVFFKKNGFEACRVRVERDMVYLELKQGDSERLMQKEMKVKVERFFCDQGFKEIYLNLHERADFNG
jgi:uncharacterized protein